MQKKGFTLVELLIVIGILAILSAATVLILNPAQILQESRDTQRINDLSTLSSAISLVLATDTTPDLDADTGGAPVFVCGTHYASSKDASPASFFTTSVTLDSNNDGVRSVAGLGWVAADLAGASGGSPLAVLPVDPTNDDTYNYQYACGASNKFEVNANMESAKYAANEGTDGGDNANVYEVGNALNL